MKNPRTRRKQMAITQEKEPKSPQKVEKPDAAPAPKKPEPEPRQKPRRRVMPKTVLRFSPTAWAKLLYFRDRGETEIGGFGVTAPTTCSS
jgi:hypothetical protein